MKISDWLAVSAVSDSAWLLKQYYKRIICAGVIGTFLTVVVVHFFPDQYTSRAQVRFIPPQVAEKYVTPNVAMQVDQRIFALTQLVNSRLTGSKMIETFGLYPERRILSTVADLVPRFQQNLQLRGTPTVVEGSTKGVPTIQISFQYSNAQQSQQVVQRIIELIYEENRRYRGEQSIGTTEFLQQEVKKLLDQLTEMESKLSTLPSPTQTVSTQYTFEVEEMHHIDSRMSQVQRDLRSANSDRTLKRNMISALEGQIATVDQNPLAQPGSAPPTLAGDRIREMTMTLRQRVDEARARYVPGQNDRVFLEQSLSKAEASLARMEEQEAKLSRENSREQLHNRLVQAKAELQSVETTRAALIAEEAQLKRQMNVLREGLAPGPDNEMERLVLTREYAVLKEQYADLTRKQRESQVASSMERRGQGETVELIEPPTIPDSAEQPVASLRIAAGTIGGMALGALLGLFSFLRNPRVRTPQHLTLLGGIPLLAELPAGPILLLAGPRQPVFGRAMFGSMLCFALFVGGCAHQSPDALLKRGAAHAEKGEFDSAVLLYRQCLKREPKNGEAYFKLAMVERELLQASAAREHLIRAVELLPERRDVLVKLAALTYQVYFGDPGRPVVLLREVEDQAQRLLEKWPKAADGYRLKTQVLIEQHRADHAITLLEKAIGRGVSDPSLEAQLSAVYYQERQIEKARAILAATLDKYSKYGPAYDLLYLQLMEQKRVAEGQEVLRRKAKELNELAVDLQLAAHLDAVGDRRGAIEVVNQTALLHAKEELAEAAAGDFWMHRGVHASAKTWFDAGKKAHPNSRNVYSTRLVDLEIMRRNPAAAKNILATELRLTPNDPLLNAYDAAIQVDSVSELQRTAAKARLETILSKMPNSAFVRLHLGRAYLRAGDLLKASQQLERSVVLDPNYAPGWIALAEADLMNGKPGLAQDKLNALLQRAPTYTAALVLKAKASLARKRPAEAAEALTKVLANDPNDLEALLTLAGAQATLQHNQEAVSLWDRAAKVAPSDPRPILMQAQWNVATGLPQQALTLLQKARTRFPGEPDIRSLTAALAMRNGDLQLAVKEYQSLVNEFPNSNEYRLGFANSVGLAGDKKLAAAEYQRIQKQSGSDARAWLNYGALMSSVGDFGQAKTAYLEAVKRDKNNAYALNNLAYMMARAGEDLQTALHYAEDAKRSMPRSVEIHDTLTYIYLRMGMTRNATAVLEEMTQWLPAQERVQPEKMLAMIRRGESGKVRTEMERITVN